MSKFKKRITKSMSKPLNDCLVIGQGYGFLKDILEMYNTVFIYGNNEPVPKAKNLILRTSIDVAYNIPNITTIFIDQTHIKYFDQLIPILTSAAPDLYIEGNEVVPKTETTALYKHGYRAVTQLGWCHHWSRIA